MLAQQKQTLPRIDSTPLTYDVSTTFILIICALINQSVTDVASLDFYRIVAAFGPQTRVIQRAIVKALPEEPPAPRASIVFYRVIHGLCYFDRNRLSREPLSEDNEAIREWLHKIWEERRLYYKVRQVRYVGKKLLKRERTREEKNYDDYVKYLTTGIKKYLPDEPIGDRNPLPDIEPPDTLEEAAWATPVVLDTGKRVSVWAQSKADSDEDRPFTALARRRREE